MNLYSKLQLSAKDSKDLINSSNTKRDKLINILVFILKVFLTVLFCIGFVSLFTYFFGNENGVVGVVTLLFLLTFRQINIGYNIKNSVFSIFIIFIIFAISPYISNGNGGIISLIINAFSIFILVFLGCYRVEFYNHAILVLSYLLLFGSRVNGDIYIKRIFGLIFGAILISICLFRNHKNKDTDKNIKTLISEFKFNSKKDLWKIKLAITVSMSMYIGEIFGLNKLMWIGIASMSVLSPFTEMRKEKFKDRVIGTFLGAILFYIIIRIIPSSLYSFVGILGGIFVGFSASYKYQTVFNALGALSMAMIVFGRNTAILTRIIDNVFAVIFVMIFSILFDYIVSLKINFKDNLIRI